MTLTCLRFGIMYSYSITARRISLFVHFQTNTSTLAWVSRGWFQCFRTNHQTMTQMFSFLSLRLLRTSQAFVNIVENLVTRTQMGLILLTELLPTMLGL